MGPAVRLDEADHDVGAALVAAPTLVQHGPGLADAGDGPEVDPELAGGLDQIAVRFPRLRSIDHRSSLFLDPVASRSVPESTLALLWRQNA